MSASSSTATAQPLLTAIQLGQLLRAARKQRGLTQAEVGARLGLSQNRVSHLEGHAMDVERLRQHIANGSQAQGSTTTPPEW